MTPLEGRICNSDGEPLLEMSEPSPSRAMVAEATILAGARAAPYFSLGLPA